MTTARHGGASRPTWAGYAPLEASNRVRLHAAWSDVAAGLRMWRTWTYLAVESVKNSYRRTVLGPWWLTLQTAAFVAGLSVVFSQILATDLGSFLPYVAIGFVVFNFLAGTTRSASVVFTGAADTIRSTRQPLSSLVFKAVAVEFIHFAHTAVLLVVLIALGFIPFGTGILLCLPALLLVLVNGVCTGLWLGTAVARFRDVGPLVASVLQALVFFTPVFYRLEDLERDSRGALVGWNPFLYLLEAFRAPLLGAPLPASIVVGCVVVTALNLTLTVLVFARHRSRIPYWIG